MNTQSYLLSGKTLSDLKKEFFIHISEYENLVILNYDQIESPKYHPIVKECRGLILEKETWKIVSKSFERFFNYGEDASLKFNFDNAFILEKIDGSLIEVFFYNDRWYMATRGSIEGQGNVMFFNMTFKDLFKQIISEKYPDFYSKLDKDFCYTFELISPENKVVRMYNERKLYLLTARNKQRNFDEVTYYELMDISEKIGVEIPNRCSAIDIKSLQKMALELQNLDEGYVCVDYTKKINGNYVRVKVKNPKHVAVAHIKESVGASIRTILQQVMLNEQDEFLVYCPEYKKLVDIIKRSYDEYQNKINIEIELAKSLKKSLENEVDKRKKFAEWAIKQTNSKILFLVYDNQINSFCDFIRNSIDEKGLKNTAFKVIDFLKMKDMNFNTNE